MKIKTGNYYKKYVGFRPPYTHKDILYYHIVDTTNKADSYGYEIFRGTTLGGIFHDNGQCFDYFIKLNTIQCFSEPDELIEIDQNEYENFIRTVLLKIFNFTNINRNFNKGYYRELIGINDNVPNGEVYYHTIEENGIHVSVEESYHSHNVAKYNDPLCDLEVNYAINFGSPNPTSTGFADLTKISKEEYENSVRSMLLKIHDTIKCK